MDFLNNIYKKKFAVVGYGREGRSSIDFLLKNGVSAANIYVGDKTPQEVKEQGVNTFFGKNYLDAAKHSDIIIRSPGVPFLSVKKENHQLITSQTEIFLSKHRSCTIGVTGTKGKSTTAKMIYEILTKDNKEVYLVGNIGNPALDYFDKEKNSCYFVYEMSSFQLQGITVSPHIAIFLNIFPDHLDKHLSMEEYTLAKENITRFQGDKDFFIFNSDNNIVKEIATRSEAQKRPFQVKHESFSSVPTIPAKIVADILGVNDDIIEEVVANFVSLPHRYEYIGKYKGIDFYNDSAATVPEATIVAINSTKNIKTILVGGSDKGSSTQALVEKIKSSTIDNVIIFQGTPSSFTESLIASSKKVFLVSSMEEAVDIAYEKTPTGGACVLSPGFASFNMFKNQGERGDSFRNAVTVKSNE